MREHKMKDVDGFTKRYDLDKLIYFEKYDTSNEAFLRERRIKKWKRAWKIALIEKDNPEWKDLSKEWE